MTEGPPMTVRYSSQADIATIVGTARWIIRLLPGAYDRADYRVRDLANGKAIDALGAAQGCRWTARNLWPESSDTHRAYLMVADLLDLVED